MPLPALDAVKTLLTQNVLFISAGGKATEPAPAPCRLRGSGSGAAGLGTCGMSARAIEDARRALQKADRSA